MVKAFVFLAGLPVLPFRASDRIDIVNVDFVADAIATLHQKDHPQSLCPDLDFEKIPFGKSD